MPQLDITSFTSQIFWLIVCFFSMYFIMANFIVPRISGVINARQKKIDDSITQADYFKEEAEKSLSKYQDMIKKASDKADKSFDKAEEELKKIVEEKQLQLAERLSFQIKESEDEIKKGKVDALKEVQQISEKISLDIAKRIGIKSITPKDIKDAIKTIEAS